MGVSGSHDAHQAVTEAKADAVRLFEAQILVAKAVLAGMEAAEAAAAEAAAATVAAKAVASGIAAASAAAAEEAAEEAAANAAAARKATQALAAAAESRANITAVTPEKKKEEFCSPATPASIMATPLQKDALDDTDESSSPPRLSPTPAKTEALEPAAAKGSRRSALGWMLISMLLVVWASHIALHISTTASRVMTRSPLAAAPAPLAECSSSETWTLEACVSSHRHVAEKTAAMETATVETEAAEPVAATTALVEEVTAAAAWVAAEEAAKQPEAEEAAEVTLREASPKTVWRGLKTLGARSKGVGNTKSGGSPVKAVKAFLEWFRH